MGNVFKTEESRAKWNAYNQQYSKENFAKTFVFFNKKTEMDLLNFLNTRNEPKSVYIKKLIRKDMENQKG